MGRDLLKDPGLHRLLFADNFSSMISGLIGSVPATTYGENIGVMAMTSVIFVVGMLMGLMFYIFDRLDLTNDRED